MSRACNLRGTPVAPPLTILEVVTTSRPHVPRARQWVSLAHRSDELFEHRRWSEFDGDDDYVFPNPRTGHPFDANRYSDLMGKARLRAGIDGHVRPSHDLRHSSITNSARAGTLPEALMSRAGHSSYATTRRSIDPAGARFRDDADRLEERIFGAAGTKNGYQIAEGAAVDSDEETAKPHR